MRPITAFLCILFGWGYLSSFAHSQQLHLEVEKYLHHLRYADDVKRMLIMLSNGRVQPVTNPSKANGTEWIEFNANFLITYQPEWVLEAIRSAYSQKTLDPSPAMNPFALDYIDFFPGVTPKPQFIHASSGRIPDAVQSLSFYHVAEWMTIGEADHEKEPIYPLMLMPYLASSRTRPSSSPLLLLPQQHSVEETSYRAEATIAQQMDKQSTFKARGYSIGISPDQLLWVVDPSIQYSQMLSLKNHLIIMPGQYEKLAFNPLSHSPVALLQYSPKAQNLFLVADQSNQLTAFDPVNDSLMPLFWDKHSEAAMQFKLQGRYIHSVVETQKNSIAILTMRTDTNRNPLLFIADIDLKTGKLNLRNQFDVDYLFLPKESNAALYYDLKAFTAAGNTLWFSFYKRSGRQGHLHFAVVKYDEALQIFDIRRSDATTALAKDDIFFEPASSPQERHLHEMIAFTLAGNSPGRLWHLRAHRAEIQFTELDHPLHHADLPTGYVPKDLQAIPVHQSRARKHLFQTTKFNLALRLVYEALGYSIEALRASQFRQYLPYEAVLSNHGLVHRLNSAHCPLRSVFKDMDPISLTQLGFLKRSGDKLVFEAKGTRTYSVARLAKLLIPFIKNSMVDCEQVLTPWEP